MKFYTDSRDDVLRAVSATETGLSAAEAEKRLGEILGIKVRVCDSGGKQ